MYMWYAARGKITYYGHTNKEVWQPRTQHSTHTQYIITHAHMNTPHQILSDTDRAEWFGSSNGHEKTNIPHKHSPIS